MMHPASLLSIDVHELDPRDYPSVHHSMKAIKGYTSKKAQYKIKIDALVNTNQDKVSCSESHDK